MQINAAKFSEKCHGQLSASFDLLWNLVPGQFPATEAAQFIRINLLPSHGNDPRTDFFAISTIFHSRDCTLRNRRVFQ